MSATPETTAKPAPPPTKVQATYRGVRLQPVTGRSTFTRDQIEKAVETAIAKNADEFAREN